MLFFFSFLELIEMNLHFQCLFLISNGCISKVNHIVHTTRLWNNIHQGTIIVKQLKSQYKNLFSFIWKWLHTFCVCHTLFVVFFLCFLILTTIKKIYSFLNRFAHLKKKYVTFNFFSYTLFTSNYQEGRIWISLAKLTHISLKRIG
jgi:hypothetical protein